MKNFTQYYEYVLSDATGRALNTLIEKISTNHTFFWREYDHFAYFTETVLPEISASLRKRRSRDLRIWSAGCSTGEEPYTLAMLLCEYFGREMSSWETGVLATDISDRVLARCREGMYAAENMAKLPPMLRQSYFERVDGDILRVKEQVRNLVLFRKLNLIREEYPFKGRFQVIFCWNVMIYFDTPTRNALVQRFNRYLEPGGYLFVGHSESLGRANCPLRYIRPAVYQKERE
jgi:chemotaxis protein methyltransferase CheR